MPICKHNWLIVHAPSGSPPLTRRKIPSRNNSFGINIPKQLTKRDDKIQPFPAAVQGLKPAHLISSPHPAIAVTLHRWLPNREIKLAFAGTQTPEGVMLHTPQTAQKEEKGATYSWAGIVELYGVLRAMLHRSWPRMESCPLHGQYNATGKRENGSEKAGEEKRANRERHTYKTKTTTRCSYLCD